MVIYKHMQWNDKLNIKLKRLNQTKIITKSVILFWLPNMTMAYDVKMSIID